MRILTNQIRHEQIAWQRSLEFIRQENALLKYRLSELVDNNEQKHFLPIAEYFQNELLMKDEMLNNLIRSISEFNADLNKVPATKKIPKELLQVQVRIRKSIYHFEKGFLSFSNKFNERMLHHSLSD